MAHCFVIQPFHGNTFDERYKDIFEPAIRASGLEPYRVDRNLSVRIPIEDIEEKIRSSKICFAEITTNNPNVWYELGYAFACGKDVIMACCPEERGSESFPFDIRHRSVTTYKTRSLSDFKNLENDITQKISSYISTSKFVEKISESPIIETEGLTSIEIAALLIIFENQISHLDSLSVYRLKEFMNKAGYRDIATSLVTRTLTKKGMISLRMEQEFNNEYPSCILTEKGEAWIISNQDSIQFKYDEASEKPVESITEPADDELPF